MVEIFYLFWFLLVAGLIGNRILFFFKKIDFTCIERIVFSLSIGLGVLSYFTLFLGFFGLLYKEVFYSTFIFIPLIFFKDILQFICHVKKLKIPHTYSVINKVIILLLILLVLLNLFATKVPPWSWDALGYHLFIPKLYIKHHGIVHTPYMVFSYLPFSIEMLMLSGMLLKNAVLSKLIVYSFGVILLLSVFSFSKRHFSYIYALIAGLIFYSSPLISQWTTQAMVDIPVGLFTFLSLYTFINWVKSKNKRWLLLSAVMAGLAAGSKYTGLVSIITIGLLIIYQGIRTKGGIKSISKYIAIFLFISILIAAPWYVKNYITTGNPVYPFFYNILGGRYWNSAVDAEFKLMMKEDYSAGNSFFDYITLPWKLTMDSTKFDSLVGIGPIFLAFVPLVFFMKKNKKVINLLLLYCWLTITFWWLLGSHQMRFIISLLPPLSIIVSSPISSLYQNRFFKRFIVLILTVTIMFNLVLWFGFNAKQLPTALELESEEDFLNNLKDWNNYRAFSYLNANLKNNPRILMIRDSRCYYSNFDCINGDYYTQAYVDYTKLKNEKELLNELNKLNITHLYTNENLPFFPPHKKSEYALHVKKLFDNLINKYTVIIYEEKDKGIKIYQIKTLRN